MDFLAIVFGLVVGTIIFIGLNKVFDIYYWGFKGMAATWLGCFFAAVAILSIIVNILGGIFGFIGTVIMILIKIGLFGLCVYGLYYGYTKLKGNKEDINTQE